MRCGSCLGAQLRAPGSSRCCSHFSLLPVRALTRRTHKNTYGSPYLQKTGARCPRIRAPTNIHRATLPSKASLGRECESVTRPFGAFAPRGGRPILDPQRRIDIRRDRYSNIARRFSNLRCGQVYFLKSNLEAGISLRWMISAFLPFRRSRMRTESSAYTGAHSGSPTLDLMKS